MFIIIIESFTLNACCCVFYHDNLQYLAKLISNFSEQKTKRNYTVTTLIIALTGILQK
jgi:hypothetical protein